ncbi:hypothetical protein J9303_01000 [Bacillaceae bacterium Marseille-Q3522]|nr:hypothetical protein [Bacillaceae bacterium Marseille-Q3522]
MDKQQKRVKMLRIGQLLDSCHGCPLHGKGVNPEKDCAGCSVYAELRQLGKAIEKKEDENMVAPLNLTVEKFVNLEKRGLDLGEMAEDLGLSKKQISNWKLNHKEEIEKFKRESWLSKPVQPLEPEEHPPFAKRNWKIDYDQLKGDYDALSVKTRSDYNKLIEEYNAQVEKYNDLLKTTSENEKSLRDEINSLKDKINSLQDQRAYKDDANSLLVDVEEELQKLKSENQGLEIEVSLKQANINAAHETLGNLSKENETLSGKLEALKKEYDAMKALLLVKLDGG